MNDRLGDRIKQFEELSSYALIPRLPVIIRVDGHNFHTYLKGAKKPFDFTVSDAMKNVAQVLLENIQGARCAFFQSDECSLLVTDWDRYSTQSWFNYTIQKVSSISASLATRAFNEKYVHPMRFSATFDARCFNLPRHEVTNYFIWRQKDAIRNSINSFGQTFLTKRSLHGQSTETVVERLNAEAGVDWKSEPIGVKQGYYMVRTAVNERTIFSCEGAPNFVENKELIESFMTEPFWKEKPDGK